MPASLPRDALRAANLGVREPLGGREAELWLVDWEGRPAVLRGLHRELTTPDLGAALADRMWQHDFLERLGATGFPAPRPLGAFGGHSAAVVDGRLWELLTYVPGHPVGWEETPGLDAVGELLARYHTAAAAVPVTGQRPSALPLADVPETLARATVPDADTRRVLVGLAETLTGELERIDHASSPMLPIHGDFTTFNVVFDPGRDQLGVIDFGLAHIEAALADVGFGLWRSGRPFQDADAMDLERVRRFVSAYGRVRPLRAPARAVGIYVFGRGLQILAKRLERDAADRKTLDRVAWLGRSLDALEEAVAEVLPAGGGPKSS